MKLIRPGVKLPTNVGVVSTTRGGGVSAPPFDGLNLGDHVGDRASNVLENRQRLEEALGIESVAWLEQVHGTAVVRAEDVVGCSEKVKADAVITTTPGLAAAVMTADCLPVVFWDQEGGEVGVAHAGWRGLVAGVLEETVHAMRTGAGSLVAWMGPAIGREAFEVGGEVREQFLSCAGEDRAVVERAFQRSEEKEGKYFADLYLLARARLKRVGVSEVYEERRCTFGDRELFSYRRDGRTGRMATVGWIRG